MKGAAKIDLDERGRTGAWGVDLFLGVFVLAVPGALLMGVL